MSRMVFAFFLLCLVDTSPPIISDYEFSKFFEIWNKMSRAWTDRPRSPGISNEKSEFLYNMTTAGGSQDGDEYEDAWTRKKIMMAFKYLEPLLVERSSIDSIPDWFFTVLDRILIGLSDSERKSYLNVMEYMKNFMEKTGEGSKVDVENW